MGRVGWWLRFRVGRLEGRTNEEYGPLSARASQAWNYHRPVRRGAGKEGTGAVSWSATPRALRVADRDVNVRYDRTCGFILPLMLVDHCSMILAPIASARSQNHEEATQKLVMQCIGIYVDQPWHLHVTYVFCIDAMFKEIMELDAQTENDAEIIFPDC